MIVSGFRLRSDPLNSKVDISSSYYDPCIPWGVQFLVAVWQSRESGQARLVLTCGIFACSRTSLVDYPDSGSMTLLNGDICIAAFLFISGAYSHISQFEYRKENATAVFRR